jgi:Tfp pilus assembly protein PilX
MTNKNQKGFVTMIIVLIVILVAVIGFAFLRVLKANQ